MVQPLIQYPIQYRYREERLWEQLHSATNGFTLNICRVKGNGNGKMGGMGGTEERENFGGLGGGNGGADEMMGGMGDVNGSNVNGEMGMVGGSIRRPSGFVLQGVPQRKQSVIGRA